MKKLLLIILTMFLTASTVKAGVWSSSGGGDPIGQSSACLVNGQVPAVNTATGLYECATPITSVGGCTGPTCDASLTLSGTMTATSFSGDGSALTEVLTAINESVQGTGTLTAAQVKNGLINNYNATPATTTYTFPPAAAGYNVGYVCGSSAQIYIDPDGTDVINLNGTALPAGFRVSSAVSCTVGDLLICLTFKTGASTWQWNCNSIVGTWDNAGS